MTGLDKARETAKKLKENETKVQEEPIAAITENDEVLRKLMASDAREEMSKTGASIPFLKVFVANKSQMTLADGKEPNNGWFYYSPTQEQFEEVHAHLLHLSRGFWMEGMPDENGNVKKRYTQIVSGVMVNDDPKPFWLLISGQARLQRFWEFVKEKSKYTAKGIPTFALLVHLKTEKVKTEKSPAMVVNFTIDMEWTVPDKEKYLELRRLSLDQEKYVEAYIKRKDVGETEEVPSLPVSHDPVSILPEAGPGEEDRTEETPF